MKDWKTYAIIILAAWCAYLTWRVSPAIIHRAYDYNHMSNDDVYWWNGEKAEDIGESQKVKRTLRLGNAPKATQH